MKVLDLPKNFVCCVCETDLHKHTPLNDAAGRPVHKGMLMICGHCGSFLVVGDSNLVRLTKQQFLNLPKDTQNALVVAKLKIEEAKNN